MKKAIKFTGNFKKDIKRLKKQNKELNKLYSLIEDIANGKKLPVNFRDHNLKGIWKFYRECHIEPDWLIIYRVDIEYLYLVRTGSHSEIFE